MPLKYEYCVETQTHWPVPDEGSRATSSFKFSLVRTRHEDSVSNAPRKPNASRRPTAASENDDIPGDPGLTDAGRKAVWRSCAEIHDALTMHRDGYSFAYRRNYHNDAPVLEPPDAIFLSPAARVLETVEPWMTVLKSVLGEDFSCPIIVVDLFKENPGAMANSIKGKDFGAYTWLRGAYSDTESRNFDKAVKKLVPLDTRGKLEQVLKIEKELADARWELLTTFAAAKNAATGEEKIVFWDVGHSLAFRSSHRAMLSHDPFNQERPDFQTGERRSYNTTIHRRDPDGSASIDGFSWDQITCTTVHNDATRYELREGAPASKADYEAWRKDKEYAWRTARDSEQLRNVWPDEWRRGGGFGWWWTTVLPQNASPAPSGPTTPPSVSVTGGLPGP